MSAKQASNLKFEIGHVLSIDIVGYSKLLVADQSGLLRQLAEVVREPSNFALRKSAMKKSWRSFAKAFFRLRRV